MSELLGIARFKFHEGKREEYLRLSDQAMEIVRTKEYDLYLNGDQSECMVIERYRDSEAAIEHAANLGDCSQRSLPRSQWFTANCSVSRAQNSERSWLPAKCRFSSPPTGHGGLELVPVKRNVSRRS